MPSRVRPLYRGLRAFGLVLGLAGTALAIWSAVNELWLIAVISIVAGVGYAILTWIPPTSRWLFPAMLTLGLGVSLVLESWLIATMLLGIISWAAWSRTRLGTPPTGFEIAPPDAVMENAGEFVEAFRSLGYERVGAYRAMVGRVPVTVSLLAAPDGISYASVTDAVLNVTSLFPDGRSLLTRNHNVVGLPPEILINPAPGAPPEELASSHAAALRALAEHGQHPLDLPKQDLPQTAIDGELRTIEWMRGMSRVPQSQDKVALQHRSDLADRIASWLAAG